jgi:hypothetical protein
MTTSTAAADRKVLADLEILSERLRRCDELLAAAAAANSTNDDDSTIVRSSTTTALLDVVGFLEASAPRMVELVEVAAQGAVSDAVLMKCLDVNDRLTKALSDIDAVVTFVDTSSSEAAAAAAEPDIAVTTAPPAITTTKSEDEFDAFLSDRVSGNTDAAGTDLL